MFLEHKEVGEVAKITKLSHAIREGAKLRGECRHSWTDDGRSCALVAACEATGLPYGDYIFGSHIQNHLTRVLPHVPLSTIWAVPALMDKRGYSREEVADWLESQGL